MMSRLCCYYNDTPKTPHKRVLRIPAGAILEHGQDLGRKKHSDDLLAVFLLLVAMASTLIA